MADIRTKFVTQTGMGDGGWGMVDGGKENYMGLCLRNSQAIGHSGLIAGGPIGT